MNAIDVEGLSCDVSGNGILADVSFSVADGAWCSVIGPNGAGKTTLLRCLMGLMTSTGSIRIFGKAIGAYGRRALAREMSYVPQPGGGGVAYTVFDFVLMGRYPHLSPFASISQADRDEALRALEMTDSAPFAARAMDTLSGGERQRVYIAAALAQGRKILMLDEPAAFLDYKHQITIHGLLRRLRQELNVTIVSVTHDATRATFESDMVLALKEGRAIFCGAPEGLYDGRVLEAVYDTPFVVLPGEAKRPPVVLPVEGGP